MAKHGASKSISERGAADVAREITKGGGSASQPLLTQERGRGELVEPVVSKRERSKDIIAAFDSRLSRVEEAMSGMEAQVDELSPRVNGLEAEDAAIHVAIKGMLVQLEESLRDEMRKIREEFWGELAKLRHVQGREVQSMLAHMEELRGDVALCKKAVAAGVATMSGAVEARHVDVPKPRSFGGSRNAREVDNFIWGLDQYFGAIGIVEDDAKIRMAALYLTDVAMLWWRRRRGDIEKGMCTISTFDDFKRELKRQFYPENAEDEARARLRRLKHVGSIRKYINEFTNLVLEIPELSDKDSLFYFMDGLQSWAKIELRRRGVQDLAAAIAEAESIVDYSSREQPKEPEDSEESNEDRERDDRIIEPKSGNRSVWKTKSKRKDEWTSRMPRDNKCFLCDGPHWARDCPQKKALNALFGSGRSEGEAEGSNEGARTAGAMQLHEGSNDIAYLGSMRLLSPMQATRGSKGKRRRRRKPRDEGIAGIGGGECHDPPKRLACVVPSTVRGEDRKATRRPKGIQRRREDIRNGMGHCGSPRNAKKGSRRPRKHAEGRGALRRVPAHYGTYRQFGTHGDGYRSCMECPRTCQGHAMGCGMSCCRAKQPRSCCEQYREQCTVHSRRIRRQRGCLELSGGLGHVCCLKRHSRGVWNVWERSPAAVDKSSQSGSSWKA